MDTRMKRLRKEKCHITPKKTQGGYFFGPAEKKLVDERFNGVSLLPPNQLERTPTLTESVENVPPQGVTRSAPIMYVRSWSRTSLMNNVSIPM